MELPVSSFFLFVFVNIVYNNDYSASAEKTQSEKKTAESLNTTQRRKTHKRVII